MAVQGSFLYAIVTYIYLLKYFYSQILCFCISRENILAQLTIYWNFISTNLIGCLDAYLEILFSKIILSNVMLIYSARRERAEISHVHCVAKAR